MASKKHGKKHGKKRGKKKRGSKKKRGGRVPLKILEKRYQSLGRTIRSRGGKT